MQASSGHTSAFVIMEQNVYSLPVQTKSVDEIIQNKQTKSSLHVNMSLCCLYVNCLVCKNDRCICYFLPRRQSLWCTTTPTQLVKTNPYFRTIQNNMQILGTDAFVSATDSYGTLTMETMKRFRTLSVFCSHVLQSCFARMFCSHGNWATFCWQELFLSRCLNSYCPTIPHVCSQKLLFFCANYALTKRKWP